METEQQNEIIAAAGQYSNPVNELRSTWDEIVMNNVDPMRRDLDYADHLVYGAQIHFDIIGNTISAMRRWWTPPNKVVVGKRENAMVLAPAADDDTFVSDTLTELVYPRVAKRYARNARTFLNIIDDDLATRLVVKEWIVKQMTLDDVRKVDIARLLPLAVEFSFLLTPDEVNAKKMTLTQAYRDAVFLRDHGLWTRDGATAWNWFGRKVQTRAVRRG